MSKYTTGELAAQCGVSVRTVQYYDSIGLLTPSELSEGGRRLYSEQDKKTLKVICFLKSTGIPLGSIGKLLAEDDPAAVVSVIIEQQTAALEGEIRHCREKLDMLDEIRRSLKSSAGFSVESIGDIAYQMENKNKLKRVRIMMLVSGLPISVFQWGSIALWIITGIWWPFAVWAALAVPYGVWISWYYFTHVMYICPKCHSVFRPKFWSAFFAGHTPTMRRLTCPDCGHKGYCVETYGKAEDGGNGKI